MHRIGRDRSRCAPTACAIVPAALAALCPVSTARAGILAGPICHPVTGHVYLLLDPTSWTVARSQAESLGGALVTINDLAENEWVRQNLANAGGVPRNIWLGLNDQQQEGAFVWTSGQTALDTNWEAGQPTQSPNAEDFVLMKPGSGKWSDEPGSVAAFGCVEFNNTYSDCNTNGVPDGCDQDCNFNAIADDCESDSDFDGVIDACDQCPGGDDLEDCDTDGEPDDCEPDFDHDGLIDDCDGCPNDYFKIEPGVCGCNFSEDDSDGDGVADCYDFCPYVPDSDGDGYDDCLDVCPNDPLKASPGHCGCGVIEDANDDGVPDCFITDNCPNDPNKTSPGACGCGVSDADSDFDDIPDCIDVFDGEDDLSDADGDGIFNLLDNCPATPNDQADSDGDGIGDACDDTPSPAPQGSSGGTSLCALFGFFNSAMLAGTGILLAFHRPARRAWFRRCGGSVSCAPVHPPRRR